MKDFIITLRNFRWNQIFRVFKGFHRMKPIFSRIRAMKVGRR